MADNTLYGGQAVIEGVMMRGPGHFAVAAQRANGEIALTCEAVPKVLRPSWQKVPLLRGAFSLVDAMTLGTKALYWAAKIAEQDTIAGSAGDAERDSLRAAEEAVGPALGTAAAAPDPTPADVKPRSSGVTDIAIGGAMVLGLLFAVGLFKVLPQVIVEVVKRTAHVSAYWKLGVLDALVRFTLFFGYITLIARMKHVFRVFQYHGAEHKAINALEAGNGLTVENARAASRLHPRCGTSFIVIVLLLSVLATAPFYGLPVWVRIPLGVLMLFPVAGVSFELLRLAGKYRDNPVAAALSRPGMWTQLLTTREPDDKQLAVAIASLDAVMRADEAARAPVSAVADPVATQADALA